MNFIKTPLVGIGQIFLQENGLAGLIIGIAMFFSHWTLGIACFLGAAIGTATAKWLKYPSAQINQGLYGFNASLAFMCTMFTFGLVDASNPLIWGLGVISAVVSTLIMRFFMQKGLVAFTFPFVLSCWIFCWGVAELQLFGLSQTTPALADYTAAKHAIEHPFYAWAEVNFGSNLITGVLIFVAIAISSPTTAMWAMAASVFSPMLADCFLDIEPNELANGLYGFSPILVASAFTGDKLRDFVFVLAGVILAIFIQYGIAQTGLATYTIGFIVASWLLLIIKAKFDNLSFNSNKLIRMLNP